MCGLPKIWGQYKHVLMWNIKGKDYLSLLLKIKKYEEELIQESEFESEKTLFVKNGTNWNQKNSKSKTEVSDITCYNCWTKGHYEKIIKIPSNRNPRRTTRKRPSKNTRRSGQTQ